MTYEFSLTIFIPIHHFLGQNSKSNCQLRWSFKSFHKNKWMLVSNKFPHIYLLHLITHVYPTHIKRSTTKPGILPQLTNEVSLDTSVSSPLKTMMTSSRALAEQASGHGFDDEFPGISSLVGCQKTGGNNNAQMLFLPPKRATTKNRWKAKLFFLFVFSFRV